MLVWFSSSVIHTRNKFLRKRRFFNKYLATVGLWLFGWPFASLLVEVIALRSFRYQVWTIIQGIAFLSIFVLHLAMYNPDNECNKGFPFHATVSQMDTLYSKDKKLAMLKVKG